MLIANPIYDAVFKFLLDDTSIARRLLSVIIDEEILELDIRPQEQIAYSDVLMVRVFRLDFKAVVRLKTGEVKKILIELQKGKELIDLMRFRRYLGVNYQQTDTSELLSDQPAAEPLPIITIYFLGFRLINIAVPVVRVNRVYTDVTTGDILSVKEEFIEKLTHDCIVIQIPRLTMRYQTRVERVLAVFNQRFMINSSNRLLDFPPDMEDDLTNDMAKRLARARADESVRQQLDADEEIDNAVERFIRQKSMELEVKDQLLDEKEKALREKMRDIEDKNKALEDKDKALEDKDKALEDKDAIIAALLARINTK